MTFDIHQKIFDADGLPLEGVARAYQDELLNLFEQSPERQALREEGFGGRWAGILLDLGQNYLGLPATCVPPDERGSMSHGVQWRGHPAVEGRNEQSGSFRYGEVVCDGGLGERLRYADSRGCR